MKICLKKNIKVGKIDLFKHEEGTLVGCQWDDKGDEKYIVDIPKKGRYTIDRSDCDVLNF